MISLFIFWPVGEVRRQRWNLPGNKCDVTMGSNPKHFCWAYPGEIWSKVNSASFYAFVFWSVIPHTLFCWMTLSTLTIWCSCFKWVIFSRGLLLLSSFLKLLSIWLSQFAVVLQRFQLSEENSLYGLTLAAKDYSESHFHSELFFFFFLEKDHKPVR